MSNSIGYQYMMDNFEVLYKRRYYIARNGRVHKIPRAFKRICEKFGKSYQEDPEDIKRMRKIEMSEMLLRGYDRRSLLEGVTKFKMKDKLERRSKRL